MSTIGNNFSRKASHLRDSFFGTEFETVYDLDFSKDKNIGNGEVEYLIEILKNDPQARKLFKYFRSKDSEFLYNEAKERIAMIEYGEVKPDQLEDVEAEIVLLLAAIEDAQLTKERELTKDKKPSKQLKPLYNVIIDQRAKQNGEMER